MAAETPLSRLVLRAASVADDVGYVALPDGQTGSLGVSSGHGGFTRFLRALVLRRVPVDAGEVHDSGIGRVGEVRYTVRAHALREFQFLGEGLLVLRGGGYP